MNDAAVLEMARQALVVTLWVALPLLAASLITGIVISLIQVMTSIQDVTLTFVPKILAVGATLLFAGAWMLRMLLEFARQILAGLPGWFA